MTPRESLIMEAAHWAKHNEWERAYALIETDYAELLKTDPPSREGLKTREDVFFYLVETNVELLRDFIYLCNSNPCRDDASKARLIFESFCMSLKDSSFRKLSDSLTEGMPPATTGNVFREAARRYTD